MTTFKKRGLLGLAISSVLTAGFIVSAQNAFADHQTTQSQKATLPKTTVAVPFFFCLTVDGNQQCTPSQVPINEGTLTLTVSAPSSHGIQFGVDDAPDECGTKPGVAIFVARGTFGHKGGFVQATLQGTGTFGDVNQQQKETFEPEPGSAKNIRTVACQNM